MTVFSQKEKGEVAKISPGEFIRKALQEAGEDVLREEIEIGEVDGGEEPLETFENGQSVDSLEQETPRAGIEQSEVATVDEQSPGNSHREGESALSEEIAITSGETTNQPKEIDQSPEQENTGDTLKFEYGGKVVELKDGTIFINKEGNETVFSKVKKIDGKWNLTSWNEIKNEDVTMIIPDDKLLNEKMSIIFRPGGRFE